MTKTYIVDSKKSKERVANQINQVLDEDVVFCNKEKKYYPEEQTFTCAHDEETYNLDFKSTASNGAEVMEDNLQDYEEIIDTNNYPEYDSIQPYDRF